MAFLALILVLYHVGQISSSQLASYIYHNICPRIYSHHLSLFYLSYFISKLLSLASILLQGAPSTRILKSEIMASTARLAGKEHMPHYPPCFLALRVLQFLFSIVLLGILAYTVYIVAFSGNCLMMAIVRNSISSSAHVLPSKIHIPLTRIPSQ